jgi:hypothetical protein
MSYDWLVNGAKTMRVKFLIALLFIPMLLSTALGAEQTLYWVEREAVRPDAWISQDAPVALAELKGGWLILSEENPEQKRPHIGIRAKRLIPHRPDREYFLILAQGNPDPGHPATGSVLHLSDQTWLGWFETEGPLKIPWRRARLRRLPENPRPLVLPSQALQRYSQWTTTATLPDGDQPAEVSRENLVMTIQNLQDFLTRYASTPQCELAGDHIFNHFASLGIAVEFEPFSFRGYTTRNIVATIPGKTDPKHIVILGAHYDSISDQGDDLAPGADDNASGTAAVMEIARVLKDQAFDFTLRFVLFSAEEWGLYGSRAHAQAARTRNEKIIGVINLDMIAFRRSKDMGIDLIGNRHSAWLTELFFDKLKRLSPVTNKIVIDPSLTWSDHSPFWDLGYSALCGIESDFQFNPNYHQTTDTIEYLDIGLLTDTTQGALMTAFDLAQAVGSVPTPRHVTCRSRVLGSLFSSLKVNQIQWEYPHDGPVHFNVYRSSNRETPFVRINDAPIHDLSYQDSFKGGGQRMLYAVRAVDANGNESHFSITVTDEKPN